MCRYVGVSEGGRLNGRSADYEGTAEVRNQLSKIRS